MSGTQTDYLDPIPDLDEVLDELHAEPKESAVARFAALACDAHRIPPADDLVQRLVWLAWRGPVRNRSLPAFAESPVAEMAAFACDCHDIPIEELSWRLGVLVGRAGQP